MREVVMDSYMVYAEDDTTCYTLNVIVSARRNGGYEVCIYGQHCGKGAGCFWTPWEECFRRETDSYRDAARIARDNVSEARHDGASVEWCAYSPALCNTMW